MATNKTIIITTNSINKMATTTWTMEVTTINSNNKWANKGSFKIIIMATIIKDSLTTIMGTTMETNIIITTIIKTTTTTIIKIILKDNKNKEESLI